MRASWSPLSSPPDECYHVAVQAQVVGVLIDRPSPTTVRYTGVSRPAAPAPREFRRRRGLIAMTDSRGFARLPLSAGDRAAVLEAARVLVKALPVERVVLYGSKARGDDDRDSDIDLLILTSRPLDMAEGFRVTELLQPVQHRHHCIISPLRLSADEWYRGVHQALGIRQEIDREGVDVPLPAAADGRPEPAAR